MKTQESIVVFKCLAECNCASIANIVIFKTNFFKTVHHFHALGQSFAALLANHVRIAIQFRESVIILELLRNFRSAVNSDVVIVDIEYA